MRRLTPAIVRGLALAVAAGDAPPGRPRSSLAARASCSSRRAVRRRSHTCVCQRGAARLVVGQDERTLDREVLERDGSSPASAASAAPAKRLDHRRGRQQQPAEDAVVGQPRPARPRARPPSNTASSTGRRAAAACRAADAARRRSAGTALACAAAGESSGARAATGRPAATRPRPAPPCSASQSGIDAGGVRRRRRLAAAGLALGLAAAQRREHGRAGARAAPALSAIDAGEHRVRADLDERRRTRRRPSRRSRRRSAPARARCGRSRRRRTHARAARARRSRSSRPAASACRGAQPRQRRDELLLATAPSARCGTRSSPAACGGRRRARPAPPARRSSAAVSPDSTTLRGALTAADDEPIAARLQRSSRGLRADQADRGHAAARRWPAA